MDIRETNYLFKSEEKQQHSLFFSLKTGINHYHLSDFAYSWTNGQASVYTDKIRQPKCGKQFLRTYLFNFSTNITHVIFPRNYHSNFLLQIYHYSLRNTLNLKCYFTEKDKVINMDDNQNSKKICIFKWAQLTKELPWNIL